jgi:hypothetical protein
MSLSFRDTPRPLQPSITQRDIKTEVANCAGGVISPILSNIYLHKLDEFVETELIPEYTRGEARGHNREYLRVQSGLARARANAATAKKRENC